MKLDEYSKLTGIRPRNLARLFDITHTYLSKLMDGHKPSYELALRIARITSQRITVEDLIPDLYKNPDKYDKK